MKIITFFKELFYRIRFKHEWNRKPWLFATIIGTIPILIGLIFLDCFFILSGIFSLGAWIVFSILFLFEIDQSIDE